MAHLKEKPARKKDPAAPDPLALAKVLLDVSTRTQPILQDFFAKGDFNLTESTLLPASMGEAYTEFLGQLMGDPQKLATMQMKFWQDWTHLWQGSAVRFMSGETGETEENTYKPEKGDRRFKSPAWEENALFDFIKQSYLLSSRYMQEAVEQTEGLDEETRQKVDFYTRQFVDAMAPGNFLLTNPEVLQETLDSGGENLIRGLQNLLEDMERGHGELAVKTSDASAFALGKTIAETPGAVIYQNDLMQLIQYEPATDKVYKRPLLVVPPWINKYYILDLRPDNSLIKWLVGQGHTVFIISWVNPDQKLAQKKFEDYMEDGIIAALAQIEKATDEPDCNVMGYCLGGTLLATTLAWLTTKGQENRIASATFLTTLIDFADCGDMKLFLDDAQLEILDKQMSDKGFLPADTIRKTFSLLRANDLIWSFVINNYLMGREPFPFDLLYWNDDSTNMPAAMHSFCLKSFYRENRLTKPGGVKMKNVPIDISTIKTPAYFLSTKEDHIAPWKATYAATGLIKGEATFTLAASGHVAGVINPPNAKKYGFWTASHTPKNPDEWLQTAARKEGSWWTHWAGWAQKHGGKKVPARETGKGPLKNIEPAPGSYVKMKAVDGK